MKRVSCILYICVSLCGLIYAQNDTTLLFDAIETEDTTSMKHILLRGLSGNVQNDSNYSALWVAMRTDHKRTYSLQTDNFRSQFHPYLTEILLKYGHIESNSSLWDVYLFDAIKNENYRLCKVLLDYGADPLKYNYIFKTNALGYANKMGLKRISKLLRLPQSYSDEYTIDEVYNILSYYVDHKEYKKVLDYPIDEYYGQLHTERDTTKYANISTFDITCMLIQCYIQLSYTSRDCFQYEVSKEYVKKAKELAGEKYNKMCGVDIAALYEDNLLTMSAMSKQSLISGSLMLLNQVKYWENLNDSSCSYVRSLVGAGIYFANSMNYSESETYLEKADAVLKAFPNLIDSLECRASAMLYITLAQVYFTEGWHHMAKQLLSEKLPSIEKKCGTNSWEYIGGKIVLAEFRGLPGSKLYDLELAYLYYHELTSLLKDSGQNLPQAVISRVLQSYLNFVYKNNIDDSKITKLVKQYIYRLDHNELSRVDLQLIADWALWCIKNHADKDAHQTISIFYELKPIIIEQYLFTLASDERDISMNLIDHAYDELFYSYVLATRNYQLEDYLYNNELFTKGLLLNTDIFVEQAIIESNDYELLKLLNNKKQLSAEMRTSYEISTIDSLRHRIIEIDRILTSQSTEYKDTKQRIRIRDVKESLFPNDVAIEFIKQDSLDTNFNSVTSIYYALILRNNKKYLKSVRLFDEKDISSLVNTSTENQTTFTYSYDGNGEQLTNLVWSKILPHVKPGETIYFAPSGLLHQLAIEALPYDETHTMADVFNLVRLSSTCEIVLRKEEPQHTTASLYGGIKYDMSGDEILAESEQYSSSTILASRGIENDTLDRGSVKYLPGTKKEVESINKMLQDNKLSVQLFSATNANEESFKALSGKHQNILHIATHGFYWADSTAQKKDYFSQRMLMMDNNMPTPPAIDPLNRCGLLFAGANTALSGHSAELPEGVQDGILTAKEISLLDLRDADLVVLSACETGKGEITGEGVFGLQRAFKQAGAQTIIMSLWPVNDAATQLLMTEFYRNWITNNQSKREAFRNAQNTVRSNYAEPVYWAGFIMLD